MNNMNEYYWIPLLIISAICLFGVMFLCIGVGLLFREKKKRSACTQPVIATVVDVQHQAVGASVYAGSGETNTMSWFSVYEYTVNGTSRRKQAFMGTAKPEVSIGQKVELYVNPECPDEFYCPTEKTASVRKVFTGVGIACISVAVIIGIVLCVI